MNINELITLTGAIALLLWGFRMVRAGVDGAFGESLRRWLSIATRNRLAAFATGLGVTCALQSSTATALLTSSFASRELVATSMGLAIMLGADIATSLIAQVLAFDVQWLSPALIMFGVVGLMVGRSGRLKAIGRAMLGLGIVLLALDLLGEGTALMHNSPVALSLIAALAHAPILAASIAAILTMSAFSSIAVILMIAVLSVQDVVSPALAVSMMLGANLGSGFLALLITSGSEPLARRIPLGNLLMRTAGVLVALPFCAEIAAIMVELTGAPQRVVVDGHLAFNLLLAGVFLPVVGSVATMVDSLLPANPESRTGPRYLDSNSSLRRPAILRGNLV